MPNFTYYMCKLRFGKENKKSEFNFNWRMPKDITMQYENEHTIRILEKFNNRSGVKSGVPSSMNDKSVRYMPKYGMHGGSQRCNASRMARNRPSEQTTACNLLMVCLICEWKTIAFCETIPKYPAPSILINATNRFGHFVPCFFQTKYGCIGEGGAHLQHAIEIMQATANVGHGCPLFDGRHARLHIIAWNDFRRHQPRAIIEAFCHLRNVFGLRFLIRFHPRLSQKFPAMQYGSVIVRNSEWGIPSISIALTRCECSRIFDGPNMSFARQFPTPITFRCSPYSTSISINQFKWNQFFFFVEPYISIPTHLGRRQQLV